MPSIIEAYNYDIFISYRQKDNKYDGWVTEFVDNLKKELEATFKEEISVYFDINPHDGLLETYDVIESLKEKLKCLIFIPVISRTYCDPNSYAWQNEFLQFIDSSGKDKFGTKISLPNGNVASRILPVRIHDLEAEDLKLLQDNLGFIRPIDFIYHSKGVNRPLRQRDDDVSQVVRQLLYRDQINKVANAIDEIIRGLKRGIKVTMPGSNSSNDYPGISETARKEKRTKVHQPGKSVSLLKWFKWPFASIILILAIISGFSWIQKQKRINWARLVQIPAIQKLVDENLWIPPVNAFILADEIKSIIPGDSNLLRLWPKISTQLQYTTNPPGANIYYQDYNESQGKWNYIGTSPIDSIMFPAGSMVIKTEKKGYQTTYLAKTILPGRPLKIALNLDTAGALPTNMVRVPSEVTSMQIIGLEQNHGQIVEEFLVDRFEVTIKSSKFLLILVDIQIQFTGKILFTWMRRKSHGLIMLSSLKIKQANLGLLPGKWEPTLMAKQIILYPEYHGMKHVHMQNSFIKNSLLYSNGV